MCSVWQAVMAIDHTRSAGLRHLNRADHVTALETETLPPPMGTLAAPTCFDMGITRR
jgi:hypothetical protein